MRGHNLADGRAASIAARGAERVARERVFVEALADADTGDADADVALAAHAAGRSLPWANQYLARIKKDLGWQARQRGQAWVVVAFREGKL